MGFQNFYYDRVAEPSTHYHKLFVITYVGLPTPIPIIKAKRNTKALFCYGKKANTFACDLLAHIFHLICNSKLYVQNETKIKRKL